jgi:hypothetical protein
VRKPWVVPWSNGGSPAPLGLRRTVEAAVRAEVGEGAGGPRASGQWVRRAFPLTVSGQGEPAAAGLPAVELQISGERGPRSTTPVDIDRLAEFGRAALRAVSAIDGIGAPAPGSDRRAPADGGPSAWAGQTSGIVTVRRVLPDWAVRLLVGAMLLPALLAALDAFFRVRRRKLPMGRWAAWVVVGAIPFLLVYGWLRLLTATGALGAPAAPVLPGDVPLGGAGAIAALVSAGLLLGLSMWAVHRALVPRLGRRGDPSAGGGAAAVGLVLAVLTLLIWFANPYAAAVLVPAAHLWMLAADPASRLRGPLAAGAFALGLALPLLVVAHYASALGLGPAGIAWLGVLMAAGGHVTPAAAVALSVFAACAIAAASILVSRRRVARLAGPAGDAPLRTRGPVSYAGPGSLGGTESALRR